MNISADSLYHFTTEYSTIEGILKTGFRYSTLKESVPFSFYPESPFSLPGVIDFFNTSSAVCFCDIPLELCGNHREQYGNYVIALSKKWGIKNGITPIRYIHRHSPDIEHSMHRMIRDSYMMYQGYGHDPFKYFMDFVIKPQKARPATQEELENIPDCVKKCIYYMNAQLMSIAEYFLFVQNYLRDYEGEWTDRVTNKNVNRRFYDEKEWRAISQSNEDKNLEFELEDVTEIIVNSESEKARIADFIKENFGTANSNSILSNIKEWKDIQVF
jgi:hypothetical protein